MSIADKVLAVNHDLPIKCTGDVHNGKVRSVYWLTKEDSKRLIQQKNYDIPEDNPLAIMVISDRISAFDCIWQAEEGLKGVPGKGAALNAISSHWFKLFEQNGLAGNHIVDIPHPFVWIVQKAKPLRIEGIARGYITGSMWRAYSQGEREICGLRIPDGLENNQRLENLLITPSTKGIIEGLDDVPPVDDVNISRKNIEDHLDVFGVRSNDDIDLYEKLLAAGFDVISKELDKIGQIFVDTKFEFGYCANKDGAEQMIYMDEVGTPDSSRIWDAEAYARGEIVENSKEGFRKFLLNHFSEPDILLNKNRMPERFALAADNILPISAFNDVSTTYTNIAEKIIGEKIPTFENPKVEIIDILNSQYQLVK